jgi:hypothetical protein
MLKAGRVVELDRTSSLLAGTASTMLRVKTDQALPPAQANTAIIRSHLSAERTIMTVTEMCSGDLQSILRRGSTTSSGTFGRGTGAFVAVVSLPPTT